MAGNKLKASSLVEVLISMIIILIVFSIAMGIYANVLRLSLSIKKHHAQAVLYQVLRKIEKSPQLSEEKFTLEGFYIKQIITNYQYQKYLTEIHLTAVDKNKIKLAEVRKVVYVPD